MNILDFPQHNNTEPKKFDGKKIPQADLITSNHIGTSSNIDIQPDAEVPWQPLRSM